MLRSYSDGVFDRLRYFHPMVTDHMSCQITIPASRLYFCDWLPDYFLHTFHRWLASGQSHLENASRLIGDVALQHATPITRAACTRDSAVSSTAQGLLKTSSTIRVWKSNSCSLTMSGQARGFQTCSRWIECDRGLAAKSGVLSWWNVSDKYKDIYMYVCIIYNIYMYICIYVNMYICIWYVYVYIYIYICFLEGLVDGIN